MNKIILVLFLTFVMFEENFSQEVKVLPENKSIEYYQEYLTNNPKTTEVIAITDTLRKMWDEKNLKNFHTDCNCNCIELLINKEKILLEGKEIKLNELKESLKYSIENPDNLENLPENEVIKTKFGTVIRSKGILDIISKDANQNIYSEIIEIAVSVFIEQREEWSKYLFDTTCDKLNEESRKEINKIIPVSIRFERYMPWNLRLPSPPEQKFQLKGILNDNERK